MTTRSHVRSDHRRSSKWKLDRFYDRRERTFHVDEFHLLLCSAGFTRRRRSQRVNESTREERIINPPFASLKPGAR